MFFRQLLNHQTACASYLLGCLSRSKFAPHLPEGAGVDFEHHALADGEVVELGNTALQAIATRANHPWWIRMSTWSTTTSP